VRLGEHTISTTRDCELQADDTVLCANPTQDIPISKNDIKIHSDYDAGMNVNDIALIRLTENANVWQNNIKPICLPFDQEDKIPKNLIVIGTGFTEFETKSDTLQWVRVKLWTNDECREKFSEFKRFRLTDNQFCAGGKL
jgi:Trypsin